MRHILIICLSLLFSCVAAFGGEPVTGTLEADTRWTGEVRVAGALTVPKGVALTVESGTTVRMGPDALLVVHGKLSAKATPDKPIRFLPEASEAGPSSWQGIQFQDSDAKSELDGVTITGAKAIQINRSEVRVAHCAISGGERGVLVSWPGNSRVIDNEISNMSLGGVELGLGSTALVQRNRISKCTQFGIHAGQRVSAYVRDNQISECEMGINIMGDIPPVEGNVIRDCKVGIGLSQSTPRMVLRRNQITGAQMGIALRNFAAPLIEDNTLSDNDDGIRLFRASSPMIRHNLLEKNKRAVACLQLCKPVIEKNVFRENDVAVKLIFSSYATIRDNNFDANRLHLELEDMSADWEKRAMKKPTRGKQAQNEEMVNLGKAMPVEIADNAPTEGAVEVPGNWWGEATTAQMKTQGPEADIKEFYDYYDLPKKPYAGFKGEFLQDKIIYTDWLSAPVIDAGPRAPEAEVEKGKEQ